MLSELGTLCLAMVVGFSCAQWISAFWGEVTVKPRLQALAANCARMQFVFTTGAFATLITAYGLSDFSLLNVYMNSHTQMPLLYKLAGAWGNHEGSLLLWVWVLSFVAALMTYGKSVDGYALGVQGILITIFTIFLWASSNPFVAIPLPPLEGQSLNPLLQDRGLAIHPPFLYGGYVGYSAVFSLAIAAILRGKIDASLMRLWSLLAWSSLTLGIALGSWWAYYELGWGGYWFWDPVENASLMPWLCGAALIHVIRVVEVKGQLKLWALTLALLTFAFSLLGTFLVRSGLISSVHAFANDPERGLIILSILTVIISISFVLLSLRAYRFAGQLPLEYRSREGLMMLNSLLLISGLVTVTWGTLYPLILEGLTGTTVSVGAPYFNQTFVPLMLPLLILAPLGVELAWSGWNVRECARRLAPSLTITCGFMVLVLYLSHPSSFLMWGGLGLGAWLVATSLHYIWRHRTSNMGMSVAHMGVGIFVLGIAGVSLWGDEVSGTLKRGDNLTLQGQTYHLRDVVQGDGPNYRYERAFLEVGGETLTPEKRLYLPQETLLSETAIATNGIINVYAILGAYQGDERWAFKLLYHPLVPWIWWGWALMSLGAVISLWKNRRRQ